MKQWVPTNQKLEHRTQELQEELERHFRELLGVETDVEGGSNSLSDENGED
jgi:hypothetical protein